MRRPLLPHRRAYCNSFGTWQLEFPEVAFGEVPRLAVHFAEELARVIAAHALELVVFGPAVEKTTTAAAAAAAVTAIHVQCM